MMDPGYPTCTEMLLNRTENFINFLKEANQSIHDFEFDCHQAAQLFCHKTNKTHLQISGFLLDYENDIKLLAPHSPFVACALRVLPFVHAENVPTMHSDGIYDRYNERGKKMRLAVQDLPREYADFKASVEYLSRELFNDPECDEPGETLHIYKAKFAKCFKFVQGRSSGVENALKVFFQFRKFIRRHLEVPYFEASTSESAYFIDSDAFSSSLSNLTDYDML